MRSGVLGIDGGFGNFLCLSCVQLLGYLVYNTGTVVALAGVDLGPNTTVVRLYSYHTTVSLIDVF